MIARVESVHISFPRTVNIGGVYLEDQMQDTLLYMSELSGIAEFLPMIRKQINIDFLEISGVKSRVVKSAFDDQYNFSPLLEAFASEDEEKEKTKSNWSVGFDEIQFEDIDISLLNWTDTSNIEFYMGHLNIKDGASELNSALIDLESIDIDQVKLKLLLGDRQKPTESSKQVRKQDQKFPLTIKLKQVNANDIFFELGLISEKLFLSTALHHAQIKPQAIDLSSKKISLKQLLVDSIHVDLSINPDSSMTIHNERDDVALQSTAEHTFGDFDWDVSVNHAELLNAACKINLNKEARQETGIDFSHLDISDFNVKADSIFFNNDNTGASVSLLSFKEISGAQLDSLSGDFFMNNSKMEVDQIFFQSPNSYLLGSLILGYTDLHGVSKDFGKLEMRSDLQGLITMSEIQPFYPMQEKFPILKNVGNIKITDFSAKGSIEDLTLIKSDLTIGNSSYVSTSARILGLPGNDVHLTFNIDTLQATAYDISRIVPDSILPDNVQLPEFIGISSKGEYGMKSGVISSSINTNLGQIEIEGSFKENEFLSNVSFEELDLSALLKDSILGRINLESQVSGTYNEAGIESAHMKADLKSIQFNGYSYQNGISEVTWRPKNIEISTAISDSSLAANLEGTIQIQDTSTNYAIALHVDKAVLNDLNFMDEFFSLSGSYSMDMEVRDRNNFKGWLKANDIDMTKEGNSFRVDSMLLNVDLNNVYTNFVLDSEIASASLTGNTKIVELKDAIIDQIDLYVEMPDSIVSDKDFEFEFNLDLRDPDIFTEFAVPQLEEIILDRCLVKYNDRLNVLIADIQIPRMIYGDVMFEELFFNIQSNTDSANSLLSLKSVRYDSININNVKFNSTFEPGEAKNSFTIHDLEDSLKYQFLMFLDYADEVYTVRMAPDQTVLNYEYWNLPDDNYLKYGGDRFLAKSTRFTNGNQEFSLEVDDKDLVFKLNQFQLQNITNFVEGDSIARLIDGVMGGQIVFDDPLKKRKIRADLEIPELFLLNNNLGKFHAKIGYEKNIDFDVRLFDDENALAVNGIYPIEQDKYFNLIFESDISNAASYQPFFKSYAQQLSGQFQGRLSLSNRKEQPLMNGSFIADDLNFTLLSTNTVIKNRGQVDIQDNTVRIDDFEVRDSLDNQFTLDGSIDLRDLSNPQYDLKMETENFLAIDSEQSADWPIFGKAYVGLTTQITGHQSSLSVKSDISINANTDITYVMPGQELELISNEGIVEFVEFEKESYESIAQSEEQFVGDSIISLIDGIDFSASLSVDPNARFTVIVDPNSGDYSTFQVNGTLQYDYNDAQRGILNGIVEFEDGFYELSFYGLVKKRFNFDPGSTVSWSGEVMDGAIDFAARHTVRTNSVGLVSNEISNYERALYNQRLPYEVILKVRDKINYPSISFELDLPQRQRSTYPTLDSKLNLLNQQNMESERNKQVFALLVGGTFIPENPEIAEGSSSDNFATTAARNSVNAIMTQQLNKLTGQFIQGFDVDMGVNTFDDYAGGSIQTRTQLNVKVSKNLFNDRVSAEMESHIDLEGSNRQVTGQSIAGMTEFAVSYKLTKTGNYRIKAFRENAFDIFDGEIQNAGLAFIFVKEFDSFKNIRSGKLQNADQLKDTNISE